jgi:hypothetical protein
MRSSRSCTASPRSLTAVGAGPGGQGQGSCNAAVRCKHRTRRCVPARQRDGEARVGIRCRMAGVERYTTLHYTSTVVLQSFSSELQAARGRGQGLGRAPGQVLAGRGASSLRARGGSGQGLGRELLLPSEEQPWPGRVPVQVLAAAPGDALGQAAPAHGRGARQRFQLLRVQAPRVARQVAHQAAAEGLESEQRVVLRSRRAGAGVPAARGRPHDPTPLLTVSSSTSSSPKARCAKSCSCSRKAYLHGEEGRTFTPPRSHTRAADPHQTLRSCRPPRTQHCSHAPSALTGLTCRRARAARGWWARASAARARRSPRLPGR